jgi:hypothetical protein
MRRGPDAGNTSGRGSGVVPSHLKPSDARGTVAAGEAATSPARQVIAREGLSNVFLEVGEGMLTLRDLLIDGREVVLLAGDQIADRAAHH